jgi:prepilin-type N-terminal cleavage/methylation domain-containing protein
MNKKLTSGFTLIEVIIYLALFSILMAGLFSGAFAILESSRRTDTRALLAEEGSFVIAKTQWELSGAELITEPGVGGSGATLSLNRAEGYDGSGSLIVVPVTFDPATLVGGRITLVSANFYNTGGTDVAPESVGLRFTLATRTDDGALLSQDFFSTTSLKK